MLSDDRICELICGTRLPQDCYFKAREGARTDNCIKFGEAVKLLKAQGQTPEAGKEGFRNGVKEGISLCAWWEDGIQYVGTYGKTLKEALKEIDKIIL